MKLDTTNFRTLSSHAWKVLAAFEDGTKHQELVPVDYVAKACNLRNGGQMNKFIGELLDANLVSKQQGKSEYPPPYLLINN